MPHHAPPCCMFRTVCALQRCALQRCALQPCALQPCALQPCALQDRRFAPRALHFALPGAPFALPVVYAVDDTAADADAPLLQQR